jgi:hypothetical protein
VGGNELTQARKIKEERGREYPRKIKKEWSGRGEGGGKSQKKREVRVKEGLER